MKLWFLKHLTKHLWRRIADQLGNDFSLVGFNGLNNITIDIVILNVRLTFKSTDPNWRKMSLTVYLDIWKYPQFQIDTHWNFESTFNKYSELKMQMNWRNSPAQSSDQVAIHWNVNIILIVFFKCSSAHWSIDQRFQSIRFIYKCCLFGEICFKN